MNNKKLNLLEHAFINQLEADLDDQEFEPISKMIQSLLKDEKNQKIIIEYLSDSAEKNWLEGETTIRY